MRAKQHLLKEELKLLPNFACGAFALPLLLAFASAARRTASCYRPPPTCSPAFECYPRWEEQPRQQSLGPPLQPLVAAVVPSLPLPPSPPPPPPPPHLVPLLLPWPVSTPSDGGGGGGRDDEMLTRRRNIVFWSEIMSLL